MSGENLMSTFYFQSSVLLRDSRVRPLTKPVVRGYINGVRLCRDGKHTPLVVWKWPFSYKGSLVHYWSSMVHLNHAPSLGRVAPTNHLFANCGVKAELLHAQLHTQKTTSASLTKNSNSINKKNIKNVLYEAGDEKCEKKLEKCAL